MATLSSNRVPIKVQHTIDSNNNENYYYRTTTRVQSPPPPPSTSTQPFGSFNDETDSIKHRMKEFEERCKRWRDDFFAKNGSNLHNLSAFNEFDAPPPPPPPPSSNLSGSTPFSTNYEPIHHAIPATLKTSPFTSTLHKSFVDTRDGRKVYKIEFEVGDFKENELQITTKGNLLLVKGDREIKVGATTETKTFNREITLPDYANTNNLNAYLVGTVLTVEAEINNDIYYQRRTNINSTPSSPPLSRSIDHNNNNNNNTIRSQTLSSSSYSPSKTLESTKSTSQVHTSTTSTSHYSSSKMSKNVTDSSYSGNNTIGGFSQPSIASTQPFTPHFSSSVNTTAATTSTSNVPAAPEIVNGYPLYVKDENCRVYKFDLKGFDQRDISLSITEKRTLEIKASKEINDSIGKSYREFKREIHLEDNVDIDEIKNSISTDGVLTLKIPYKPQQQQQINLNSSFNNTTNSNIKSQLTSSLKNLNEINTSNTNTTITANFREYFSNDGKLAKLTYDFNEYEPENIKIFLTTNNELKISAQINDSKTNRIQKQCFRQYNLPSYIQPEQMRAVMSRDGLLTIDFKGATQQNNIQQQQIDQNHRVFLKA